MEPSLQSSLLQLCSSIYNRDKLEHRSWLSNSCRRRRAAGQTVSTGAREQNGICGLSAQEQRSETTTRGCSFFDGSYSLVTIRSTLCVNTSFEKHPKIRQREGQQIGRHWPLSRRWGYTSEVCSGWLKEVLENVGKVKGQAGIRLPKAGTVTMRRGNEINWYTSVNPKSIELGPIE